MKRMKRRRLLMFIIGVFTIVLAGLAAYPVWRQRGIPFVAQKEQWTIGIYSARDPFSFDGGHRWFNPVLRAEDVTDVPAKFVADPFLIKEGATWYLFFEVYNRNTKQGDEAVATSTNTYQWDYQQVILDEPFHLSYPYVFKWEGEYYLIPESFEANSVRLYKADVFPTKWSFVTTLVDGGDYVDNSIAYYNGKWWLFSATTSNDTLHLFYADQLTGPFVEHPESPIVKGSVHKARSSGRVLVFEDRLYRYTMDVDPPEGTHWVWAYEITEITPTTYSERLAVDHPIIRPGRSGWNQQAMHQIDPVQVKPDEWIASVDGYGKYLVFGWNY
jgi:hypothetical protein